MDIQIPGYLPLFNVVATTWVIGSLLVLIWIGVSRSPARQSRPAGPAIALSAGLLGWYMLADYLGRQQFYWAPFNQDVPTIPFGILVPVILIFWLLTKGPRFADIVDAIPLSWLAGVQVYRTLGVIFIILWWEGDVPGEFGLPAGIGDVIVGILALAVAAMLARKSPAALGTAYAWCLFGIADFLVAVGTGFLTSPGIGHFLSVDNPNLLITAYPLVMVPTFIVPISIILHGLALWKIARLRGGQPGAQVAGA